MVALKIRTGGSKSPVIIIQNHTQPIPCEQYDEVCGQSQLFRKFASLSYQWDVDKIDQTRYRPSFSSRYMPLKVS